MRERVHRRFKPYGVAVLVTAIALVLTLLLESLLPRTIGAFFFLAVILSTYYGGLKPGIFSALLATLLINYFFIPHNYHFSITDASDLLRFGIFCSVVVMVNFLNNDLRRSQHKILRLNQQLLQETALQQRINRERVIAEIARRIRQSLRLKEILTIAVEEVRQFLQTDRVVIFRFFDSGHKGKVLVESVGPEWMPILSTVISDPCFAENFIEPFRQGLVTAKADIYTDIIDQCHSDLLAGFQVRANLVVPVLEGETLWGLLIAHHCSAPRLWQADEIDLLKQLATQLGIAIQQASLVEKLQTELNERQRAEAALRESEERWQLAITGSNDGIWDHNLITDELFMSPRGMEIVNYRYYEIDTFEKWLSFVHPDDLARLQAVFQDHFNRKTAYMSCEYRVQCKDGAYKWVLVRGQAVWDQNQQPIRLVGSITDISDRKHAEAELQNAKNFLELRVAERTSELQVTNLQLQQELAIRQQAEAALQEAEQRWRSLLEEVQLVVVSLNQSGEVEYVNPFFFHLTGYCPEEVLGKNWVAHFVPAHAQPAVKPALEQVLEECHSHHENSIVTKAGEERLISWNNTLLKDTDGNYIGTISIGEDITKRQEIDRMKREFVSIVSHELRTPLTAIRGSLGLLAAGVYNTKPDKATQMLRVASEQSDRLVRLVNDILDLQRLESGRIPLVMQWCNAATLIQQSVDAMRPSAEAEAIQLHVDAPSIELWAAPDAIVQTLTNLISNAIKFSDPNRKIWISAARSTNKFDPYVLFQVRDEGRGIPLAKLETIFERFQQVDASDSRQKGGTGLGLTICRHIVQQHEGRIWAESQVGQGTTFSFKIPLLQPSAER